MKNKTLMILLGIIAVNLTIQTVKDIGLFPTAYAQDDVQKVAICNTSGYGCADLKLEDVVDDQFIWALSVINTD